MNILQRENFRLRDRIVELKGEIQSLKAQLKMESATLADREEFLGGRLAGQAIQDFVRWTAALWILGESLDRMLKHAKAIDESICTVDEHQRRMKS